MHRWLKQLYWNEDAFKSTTNFEHIKTHYYWSQTTVSECDAVSACRLKFRYQVNPTRVVPVGPIPNIEPL